MKKRLFQLIALIGLGTTLLSCHGTENTGGSSQGSTDNSFQQIDHDFTNGRENLTISSNIYYNGVQDKNGTYATVEVESRDNVTGSVIVVVKAKEGYNLLNVIARDSQRKRLDATKSSVYALKDDSGTYNATKVSLTLTDSNITLYVYISEDATENLSNDVWDLVAELPTSRIFSATVTSADLNAYFGQSLNYSAYGYFGKSGETELNQNDDGYKGVVDYVNAHCYYSSNDYECYSFVKDDGNNMAYTYLGADNKQGFQTIYSTSGSAMKWDSTYLGNSSDSNSYINLYTMNPFNLATIGYGDDQTVYDLLKGRFSATNVGDGTIKLVSKQDSKGFDFGDYFDYILAFYFNSVYSGNLQSSTFGNASFEIIVNPTEGYIESMKGEFTCDFTVSGITKNFHYNINMDSWNAAPISDGIPGSWNAKNGSIASYYTAIYKSSDTTTVNGKEYKLSKNSVFAYPNVTPMTSNITDNADAITQRGIINTLKQGNYSVDISSRMVLADGYPSGVGVSDRPLEGTIKVALGDNDATKGVYSTMPTIIEFLEDETGEEYDATFFGVGAVGALNTTTNKVSAYGIDDLNDIAHATKLSDNGIAATKFYKGDGFDFDIGFLNLEKGDNGEYVYYRNLKESNNYSSSQSKNILAQFANPFDFAFGQAGSLEDSNLYNRYGYVADGTKMKSLTITVTDTAIEVEVAGWLRAYGSNIDYSVTYSFYDIGTTTFTSEETTAINAVAALN